MNVKIHKQTSFCSWLCIFEVEDFLHKSNITDELVILKKSILLKIRPTPIIKKILTQDR